MVLPGRTAWSGKSSGQKHVATLCDLAAPRRDARGHQRTAAQSRRSARGRQAGAGTGGALRSKHDVFGHHLREANIHFPVDWVLLRDGVKSLMQSVELIRTHGLKSRMCEPQELIKKI